MENNFTRPYHYGAFMPDYCKTRIHFIPEIDLADYNPPDSPNTTSIIAMSSTFQIIGEGLAYVGIRYIMDIDVAFPLFSTLLKGKSQAATFNALSQGLRARWTLQDDVVNPFGDRRQALVIVYVFDLDRDLLLFANGSQNLQLPLSHFRGENPVTLEEFTVFEPPSAPELGQLAFSSPTWELSSPVSPRTLPFITRIFSDFGYQWRHILRSPHRDTTFRQLARAILCIVMLEFETLEVASRWLHASPEKRPYVWIHDLPFWQPYEERILHRGNLTIILDQDLERAMATARQNIAGKNNNIITDDPEIPDKHHIYLLLSVRHIAFCRIDSKGDILYTKPVTFLNGIDAPSSAAVEQLLQGISVAVPSQRRTRLHKLPIEIQDRILKHVSEGPFEAARIGCSLNLGSPFTWTRNTDDGRRTGPIERFESYTHRSEVTPVESQVWFAGTFSGLSYR